MRQTQFSFGISARLGLGFAAVLVLLVLIAGYGAAQISSFNVALDKFVQSSEENSEAAHLQTQLKQIQIAINRLSALNTQANKTAVEASYADVVAALSAQADSHVYGEFKPLADQFAAVVSGPTSLAAVQDKVELARGEVAEANVAMSETVARMLNNIGDFGDIEAIATIQDRVLRARMLLRSYQFTGSSDEVGDALAALRDAERKFDQFGRMGAAVANNPLVTEGRKNLEVMFAGLAKIRTAVTEREKTVVNAEDLSAKMSTMIGDFRAETAQEMSKTTVETEGTISSAFRNSLASAGFAIVLGIALAFLIARSITLPIRRMTHAMQRLSSGELSTEIPGVGRRDEIGEMAHALHIFKEAALEQQRTAEETAANRIQGEEARRKAEAQAAEEAIGRERAFVIANFGSGIRALAEGDLTMRLQQQMPGEYEQLRYDFNEAMEQLRLTLTEVAGVSMAVDGGSLEISRSSDDLSKRTEQQAASLEETAAALDEITVNVSNSSRRADEARAAALQANQSASQSGEVVAKAINAMGSIERSSSEISNIIGVIDEIAFQTNLLALNAGVEAARAGEAGKGFAVVAQEVRELAQRSAKAAKEIKDLIRNSGVEVENGVKLVSETGQVLKTIEHHIATVTEQMEAIATSAREQAAGLAEVNTAVNQMDQVTQQNAAMVEEANSASATLASETARLKSLVERFRIETASASRSFQKPGHESASGGQQRRMAS